MADAGKGDYDLCGWRVASELALPELPLWTGDGRAVQVTVGIGVVPDRIDDPVMATPLMQVGAQRRARFSVPGVADYLVEDGSRITIAPRIGLDAPEIRMFLFGTGLGLLCHQRGVVPIHASAVEIDGEAVLFCGASGSGKSTLAAAFMRRGYQIMSDDVAPFDLSCDGGAILPSLRRVRLWADSAAKVEWDGQKLERCRPGLEKFSRTTDLRFRETPLRPGVIIYLRQHSSKLGGTHFQRLKGRAAAAQLHQQVYRLRSLMCMVGPFEGLVRTTQVASRFPRHLVMDRAMRFDSLDDTLDEIVTTVRAVR